MVVKEAAAASAVSNSEQKHEQISAVQNCWGNFNSRQHYILYTRSELVGSVLEVGKL